MKNKEKFLELIKNDDFLTTILRLETLEEMQNKFLENGVEIDVSEVEIIRKIVDTIIAKGTIELSQDDLDKIVGGEDDLKPFTSILYEESVKHVIQYFADKIFAGSDWLIDHTVNKIKKSVADRKAKKLANQQNLLPPASPAPLKDNLN